MKRARQLNAGETGGAPVWGGDAAPASRDGVGAAATPAASSALDKGARALVLLFFGALVVGAVVIAVHPGYRAALRSMLPGGGGDAASPIWQSNGRYYGAADSP